MRGGKYRLSEVCELQDLVSRLLERKPNRRLGMGSAGVDEVRKHRWFDGLDWDALHSRKLAPPRKPKEDSAKRLRELVVRWPHLSAPLRSVAVGDCDSGLQ